jgi:hypothetical protein
MPWASPARMDVPAGPARPCSRRQWLRDGCLRGEFFYDAEIAGGSTGVKRFQASRLFVLLQRRDSVQLVTAFNEVHDRSIRTALLRLVEQVGKMDAARRA